jgi:predicted TIM-barrel fold metal-dependent hydrolase
MIDVNAYLGHFAFRRLRHNTARGLLELMDRAGIEQAAVSSASAITYRNAHSGNEEVAAEVKTHRDRLVPFAVLNPVYAGWRDDLKSCQNEFGMRGLRIYPNWHNYRLSDPACEELVNAAAERGMSISIPLRVEDRRQQSWLVDVPDVDKEEIAELVRRCPKARFMLLNGSGYPGSSLGRRNSGLPANYVIEISLLTALIRNELGQLIENLGEERLVFGTGMPFHSPGPALAKLDVLDASAAVKEKIRRGNAAQLLRLQRPL